MSKTKKVFILSGLFCVFNIFCITDKNLNIEKYNKDSFNLIVLNDFMECFSIDNNIATVSIFCAALNEGRDSNYFIIVSLSLLANLFYTEALKNIKNTFNELDFKSQIDFYEYLIENYEFKKLNADFILLLPKLHQKKHYFDYLSNFDLEAFAFMNNKKDELSLNYCFFLDTCKSYEFFTLNLYSAFVELFECSEKLRFFDWHIYIMGHGQKIEEKNTIADININRLSESDVAAAKIESIKNMLYMHLMNFDLYEIKKIEKNLGIHEPNNNFKDIVQLFNDKIPNLKVMVFQSCYNSGKKIKAIYDAAFLKVVSDISIINIGLNYDLIHCHFYKKMSFNKFFEALNKKEYFEAINSIVLYSDFFEKNRELVKNITRYFLIKHANSNTFVAQNYADYIYVLDESEVDSVVDLSANKALKAILLQSSKLEKLTLKISKNEFAEPVFVPIEAGATDYKIGTLIIELDDKVDFKNIPKEAIELFLKNSFFYGEDKSIKLIISKLLFKKKDSEELEFHNVQIVGQF